MRGYYTDCAVEWCSRRALAKNFCGAHYQRAKNGRDMNAPLAPLAEKPPCAVGECNREASYSGLCAAHYQRSRDGRTLEGAIRPSRANRNKCVFPNCGVDATTGGGCAKHFRRASKYSMSIVQLAVALAPGRSCDTCAEPLPSESAMMIDHDHSCCPGEGSCGSCIRGVLCNTCNTLAGHFEADPGRIDALLAYLGLGTPSPDHRN